MMSVDPREQKTEMATKGIAMKRFVSRVEPRQFLAAARAATEHDVTKIVNNSAVLLGNVGYLYYSGGALLLYLSRKQDASLEQRKVVALEMTAKALAKMAGIELPNPSGVKKSVALADTIGAKCTRWVCLAGNMDGFSYVASKGVAECTLSA